MKRFISFSLIAALSVVAASALANDGYRKFYRHVSASSTTNITDVVNSFSANPSTADLPLLQQEITALTVKGLPNGTNALVAAVTRITKGTTFTVSALTNLPGVNQGTLTFSPSIVLGTGDTFRVTLDNIGGVDHIPTNAIIYELLQE